MGSLFPQPDSFSSDLTAKGFSTDDDWYSSYGTGVYPWAVRVEVERAQSDPDSDGDYEYRIQVWMRQCGDSTCSTLVNATDGEYYDDTRKDYNITTHRILDRTVELSSTMHTNFSKYVFGWTTATGAATQTIDIENFNLSFVRPSDLTVDP